MKGTRMDSRTTASRTRAFDKRDPETETSAIARVASQIAQIIEDNGPAGSWIVAQAAHDAILQRSRLFREHGYTLQARSQANALAYLAHLIGEAVRTARS